MLNNVLGRPNHPLPFIGRPIYPTPMFYHCFTNYWGGSGRPCRPASDAHSMVYSYVIAALLSYFVTREDVIKASSLFVTSSNLLHNMCIKKDHMQNIFYCLGKFPKKLADDQCSSITKGRICYRPIYETCTYNLLAWKCIEQKFDFLMEVSTMFYICTYCVFTFCDSNGIHHWILPITTKCIGLH